MSHAIDLVVVGSLNADLTARVQRHPSPGETLRATELNTSAGGKGSNQAVAAARLGARTAMVGRVGTDAHADVLLNALRADGVDVTRTLRDGDAPTGTALIAVAESGENTVLVAGGANARLSAADLDAAHSVLVEASVVSLVLEVPVATVVAAARAAHESAARVVLNLSPVVELPPDVVALADPLIVNEHEAREILHRNGEHPPGASVTDHAEALCRLGARSAVVTLGAAGAVVSENGHTRHFPGPAVEVLETTGAGDAFAATVAWRLSLGDTLATATRWGVRVGAYSVRYPGTHPSYPTCDALSADFPAATSEDP
ncbi:ribokinase [Actinopolyspora biskrensis]|uniref:Ribokinase n=1 Tax=Actinopolyspora biskrensis TaxID=1470178 RepID=A0A852Z2D1_9ACTN|nr:ribokinase [Actinopolyspora biskrensis]NYH77786.1 ribokinase [Actinopolyspora biskrensis]